MIRTRLNIGILYLTLFVLLISSCETGHEIIEEDDCGTVLLGDLKLNELNTDFNPILSEVMNILTSELY